MPHGHVHQHDQNDGRGNEPVAHGRQLVGLGGDFGLLRRAPGGRAVAARGHRFTYFIYAANRRVEVHLHGVRQQAHVHVPHAVQLLHALFHVGAARRAGHSLDIKGHNAPPLFQLPDQLDRLVHRVGFSVPDVLHHAGVHVLLQYQIAEALQSLFHRRDLYQYIPAVAVFIQHLADAPQLPGHAVQTVLEPPNLLRVPGRMLVPMLTFAMLHAAPPPFDTPWRYPVDTIIYPHWVFVKGILEIRTDP